MLSATLKAMKLTFLGATRTVTGSKYLLESAGKRVLVDCGLFQGYKELRLRNWDEFPIDPASIDLIVLTHAHIDHSGYIPLLVKNGFKGKVICTHPTKELCEILLKDSGYLQEEDARRANKYNYSKHKIALPLYTVADAKKALTQFESLSFGEPYYIDDGFHFAFNRAGHILGAASIRMHCEHKSIVFSGDIGRFEDPLLKPPADIDYADILICESTYGNKLHDTSNPIQELGAVIRDTAARGGAVLIPSFAVGRAQSILYYLKLLKESGDIPHMPIYLDSPMATSATNLLCSFSRELRVDSAMAKAICSVASYVTTPEESYRIGNLSMPRIIVSASGMATGGRVLHHLKQFLPNYRHTVLFAGFQAGGTRGDRLLRGEKEVKIHGQLIPVKASVHCLNSLSAHADYKELLQWLSTLKKAPTKVFITHGEQESALAFKDKIQEKFGWDVTVPEYLDSIDL